MKPILTRFFCIIVILSCVVPVWAQERALTMDEMIRRLGGDPDKARADAAKRALKSPTPEEKANYARAIEMSASLTDDIIANIPSSDPLLLALYANCIGTRGGNEHPWVSVVDRDIRRRPEAEALFQPLFRKTNLYESRFNVMRWLASNVDVPWGNDIMEEAIKLYRADPSKWEYGEVLTLCGLIMVRGNESHLEFLDELKAKGVGDNGAARWIRRRLEQAGDPQTAKAAALTVVPMSALPHQTNPSARQLAGSNQIYWMASGVLVVLAGFGLWWRMRKP
jgi:hypothetical protein